MGSLVVGLMSGTSLDGVDAALVDFSSGRPQTLGSLWLPYSDILRQQALALHASQDNEIHHAAVFSNVLAHRYAEAVGELLTTMKLSPGDISAIACHGQTIRHQPGNGYSIQLNNPALLAELTGVTVVADFRSRDIAAGGQGAPLVPAFHAAIFGDPQHRRAVLNLGGIANLTILVPGLPVTGFDCGPGNLLMDAWIGRHQQCRHDANGEWAARGKVLPALLDKLLDDAFFGKAPPKSCGRDEFNLMWLDKHLSGEEAPADVQATLLELTAESVTQAIKHWGSNPDELFVCGGGVHNGYLMSRIQQRLPACRVASTDALGQPADWVEAVAFAWLGWQTLQNNPGNLPEVTGARGARILGAIYPA